MLIAPRRLKYGEPEERAFWPVLRAIEDAFDVHDLQPEFRAVLADLHQRVGLYVGEKAVTVPQVDAKNDWTERYARQSGPGGLESLRHLLDHHCRGLLIYRGRFDTVFEVDDATDAELLAVPGIGARRLAATREAIAQWRDPNPEDCAPEPKRGPAPKPLSPWQQFREVSRGPGGIDQLTDAGWITCRTWCKLMTRKLPLVDDVERADRDGLLTREHGFGPRVLASVREAIRRYHEQQTEENRVPPAGAPDVEGGQ